jgi:hypothetical protein
MGRNIYNEHKQKPKTCSYISGRINGKRTAHTEDKKKTNISVKNYDMMKDEYLDY